MKHPPLKFYARCNLLRWDWEKRLTPEQNAEAKAGDYPRRFVELVSERRDPTTGRHGRWEVGFPECAGFETHDAEAFERHMADEHGRRATGHRDWSPSNGMWNGPRLTEAGKPFVTKADVESCTCGLIAEHDGSNAAELWWAEHLRGCALAARAAS